MSAESDLQEYFGHSGFRPGQSKALGALRDDRDILFVHPTGGGKSLVYQLRGLELRRADPRSAVLVVTPLISLMADQVTQLNAIVALDPGGLPVPAACGGRPSACFLGSGQGDPAVEVDARRGRYAYVFASPEKVAGWGPALGGLRVSLFAIDEAHCISSQGHDFRPHYRALGSLRISRPGVSIAALTATATRDVRRDICASLGMEGPVVVRTLLDRANLRFECRRKGTLAESVEKLRGLVKEARPGRAIVYATTRKETEKLAKKLRGASAYHAGLSVKERERVLSGFVGGKIRCVVATIAFGMGINVPDVRLVGHYGLPRSLEAYYQEAGRAGRDGKPARCVLLWSPGDAAVLGRLGRGDPRTEERLGRVLAYASRAPCLRGALLAHFGEQCEARGNCCDRCDPVAAADERDVTRPAGLVLRAVRDVPGGSALLCSLLAGSQSKKVVTLKARCRAAHGLWGIGANEPVSYWRDLFDQLVLGGQLERSVTRKGLPITKISDAGRHVLSRGARVFVGARGGARARRSPEELSYRMRSMFDRGLEPEAIATELGQSEDSVVDYLVGAGLAEVVVEESP